MAAVPVRNDERDEQQQKGAHNLLQKQRMKFSPLEVRFKLLSSLPDEVVMGMKDGACHCDRCVDLRMLPHFFFFVTDEENEKGNGNTQSQSKRVMPCCLQWIVLCQKDRSRRACMQ